jgi:hypothetical protein
MRKIVLCLLILVAVAVPVLAQDEAAATVESIGFLSMVGSALFWATLAIVISQAVSILVMWSLGLPPGKLVKEIEDVQNPAVGAIFFVISLTATIFVGFMTSDGFTPDPSALESAAWIIGGVLLGILYTILSFIIAHRVMGRVNNESVYGYIRREVILEQNAALAFFLGGLIVSPFISIVFQLL